MISSPRHQSVYIGFVSIASEKTPVLTAAGHSEAQLSTNADVQGPITSRSAKTSKRSNVGRVAPFARHNETCTLNVMPNINPLALLASICITTIALAQPSITSFSTANRPTGGGNTIQISGTFFTTPTPTVRVGGSIAPLTAANATSITCTAPAGVGSQLLTVTQGTTVSNALVYTYDRPVVTTFSPSTLSPAGGTSLTIVGTNFGSSGASVRISGLTATVTSQSNTVIVCTCPAGSGVRNSVQVDVGGQASVSGPVIDYAAPIVSSIAPGSTMPTQGGSLNVSGTNFGNAGGLAFVEFGLTPLNAASISNNAITVNIPAGEGVGIPVRVTLDGQRSNSINLGYAPPSILSVSPNIVNTDGSTLVTISGSNFGLNPVLTLGGKPVQLISRSHTSMTFNALPGEGSSISLVLTVGGQTATSTLSYLPPAITSIAATSRPTSGGTLFTISGSNFGLSPSVSVDTAPAGIISRSHTSIQCALPPGAGLNRLVTVTVAGAVASANFSYDPPTITSISPQVVTGEGGETLAILGSNLVNVGLIRIDGNSYPFTSRSNEVVKLTLPALTPGPHALQVIAGGVVSPTFAFTAYCRGDFNHDDSIDFFDYLDFVDAFSIGC